MAMELPKSIIASTHGPLGFVTLAAKRVLLLHLLKESETLDSTPSWGSVLYSRLSGFICLSVLSILRQFSYVVQAVLELSVVVQASLELHILLP